MLNSFCQLCECSRIMCRVFALYFKANLCKYSNIKFILVLKCLHKFSFCSREKQKSWEDWYLLAILLVDPSLRPAPPKPLILLSTSSVLSPHLHPTYLFNFLSSSLLKVRVKTSRACSSFHCSSFVCHYFMMMWP